MRIVIDMQGAQTESRFRGMGRYSLSFAQAIIRNRGEHEVFLALSGLFPDTIEPIRAVFEGFLPQENIRVWYAPGPVAEGQPGNEKRRKVAELIREAYLASLQPDVIHICSLFEGFQDNAVTSIGKFDRQTPISVTLYDLIPLLNPDQYLSANLLYSSYYQRKIACLNKASCLLSISDFTQQEGRKYLQVSDQSFYSVSTAAEQSFQPQNISDDAAKQICARLGIERHFLLYTGGCDERKNLARLIQAYFSLPQDLIAKYQLIIAGKISQEQIKLFQRQAADFLLGKDRLFFLGYVSDEDLVQLYNLCEVFVFPSWHEGFGLPALEAMACGTPVIAANSTSLPEVIGNPDALFDPFSITSIASKLQEALRSSEFREKLRQHGLQQAKNFSWDFTAKRAFSAWQTLECPKEKPYRHNHPRVKPRLAFVSPFPPLRTGIADYSSILVPALASYYDIDVVVDQWPVEDAWIKDNCEIRDVSWLRSQACNLDRVIYQVGNSPCHQYMLPLIKEVPGIVVLHDFFLSALKEWLEVHAGKKYLWRKALYEAHGYDSLVLSRADAAGAKLKYPVNHDILQFAQGVIVHSHYSQQLLDQWYGDGAQDRSVTIPLVRKPPTSFEKTTAKKQLGFQPNDFVVCCFGFLDLAKLNQRLLDCWRASCLSQDVSCHLVYVGENEGGPYGANLLDTIRRNGLFKQVTITGFTSSDVFHQYLMAADVAVQLRTHSRGETSAAVLDCMNYALPLVVNANGSMGDLDYGAVWLLPDNFQDSELVYALETLRNNSDRRDQLGSRAQKIISENHLPAECAKAYARAIEKFHHRNEVSTQVLLRAVVGHAGDAFSDDQLMQLSQSIAASFPLPSPAKRLFLDITSTCRNDLKTGIERVSTALIKALIESPPIGFRIEPVYLDNVAGSWCHRFARRYTFGLLGVPADGFEDDIVDPECGDFLLQFDYSGQILVEAEQRGLFQRYRDRGVFVYATVFDLLPLQIPEVFPISSDSTHQRWLQSVSTFDGALCISKSVASDLAEWLSCQGMCWSRRRSYAIGWFHLGADYFNSAPNHGLPKNFQAILTLLKACPVFLMVGTVEPRKGYVQVLEAFTQLWNENVNVNLVVVGNEGWKGVPENLRRNIPETLQLLRSHPEANKRLFWFEGVSDECLEIIYAASTCLIAASYGEGFGLPLIEAAQHQLPIIARDIPVFREVAGDHAFYFDTLEADILSKNIKAWLRLYYSDQHPRTVEMRWFNWKESAAQLVKKIVDGVGMAKYGIPNDVVKWATDEHLNLIHKARSSMVSTLLPQGDIILDLGGANCPLYKMGYPHKFKKLYLIDLPPEDRCEMYKEIVVDSSVIDGDVVVKYADMTDLDAFADESVDFVWSGQSIEHVPIEAARSMCTAAFRVLRTGGSFCLDTPNRLITRIHTQNIGGGFIHPEHCYEYEPVELRLMLAEVGFSIFASLGICEMQSTALKSKFDYTDFFYGQDITNNINDSYIQFFHCVKP